MKEKKVIKLSLIILSIILMICLTSSVYAADLINLTANTTGNTDTPVDITNGRNAKYR